MARHRATTRGKPQGLVRGEWVKVYANATIAVHLAGALLSPACEPSQPPLPETGNRRARVTQPFARETMVEFAWMSLPD